MKKHPILKAMVILSSVILIINLITIKGFINFSESIEKNYFILAVGIDKPDKEGSNVRITIMSEDFTTDSGSKSTSKKPDVVSSEGATFFEAVRNFNYYLKKKLFWGHVKYIIISEDVAKDDILKYLDFMFRDHEIRYDAKLLLTKDSTAENILQSEDTENKFIPDILDSLFSNSKNISISKKMTLSDAITNFSYESSDVYLPYISIRQDDGEKTSNNNDNKENSNEQNSSENSKNNNKDNSKKIKKYISLEGYGIIKENKLIGYISEGTSRGLNWIENEVDSTVIVAQDENGENISLEVMDSDSKVNAKLNNDNNITVNICIKVSSNIGEQMSKNSIYNLKSLNYVENSQSQIIKSEVFQAINFAQENGVDIFNISDKIYHKYPLKWEKIKSNWRELFKKIVFNVSIQSRINRTYNIKESITTKSGE